MALVARYAVVPNSDTATTVPGPSGISDHHYQGIQAPGLVTSRSWVLFYKVNPDGTPTLSIRINSTPVVNVTFAEGPQRALQEIIPGTALHAADNELTVAVTGNGSVSISDIVILYSANT